MIFWGLCFSLTASTTALASGKHGGESKPSRERAARKACLTGDFAKGVSILSDLFIDTHDPTYVFNQGRCFEQNRRYDDAVARFEEYLRIPNANLSADDRTTAEKHIADCKEKLPPELRGQSTPTAPQTFVATPPVVRAPESPSTTEVAPVPPPTVAENLAATSADHGSGLRVGGIVVASVGVAALAGGVILNVKANSMVSDWENKAGTYSNGQESSQKTYKTLAWVGYGLGAACLVTGAVLLGVGFSKGNASSRTDVALVPTFGPGGAGAALVGGF
jgi:hypothetical protein